jgi:hypothetical protein
MDVLDLDWSRTSRPPTLILNQSPVFRLQVPELNEVTLFPIIYKHPSIITTSGGHSSMNILKNFQTSKYFPIKINKIRFRNKTSIHGKKATFFKAHVFFKICYININQLSTAATT